MLGLAATQPDGSGLPNAAWLGWWPTPLGCSWLLDGLHLGSGVGVAGDLLWLVAGLALLIAGLGLCGVPVLHGSWPALALGGAALGLLAVAVYFHPWYAAATLINLALLLVAWAALRPAALSGA
ncbi:MAG TPA: hypothetical protein VFU78_22120 [Thermomicrobiales bacterium]|nr:hypothetical protein [Thermomicrobiales bacterium]